MTHRTLKLAVVSIAAAVLFLFVLKMLNLTELAFLFGLIVLCGVAVFRIQKRRERRQLELMRDSALW